MKIVYLTHPGDYITGAYLSTLLPSIPFTIAIMISVIITFHLFFVSSYLLTDTLGKQKRKDITKIEEEGSAVLAKPVN